MSHRRRTSSRIAVDGRIGTFKTDEYGLANYGKWLPVSDDFSAFINNPSMSALHVWARRHLRGQRSVKHTTDRSESSEARLSGHGLPFCSECSTRVCSFSARKIHRIRLLQSRKGARVVWSLFLLALEIRSGPESTSHT